VSVVNWESLIAAAQAGDARCYERLLKETSLWMRRYYARRLPASMIDDATQDGLIAVHEKRHTYDGTRPFGPWLAAIARYKWIDRLRTLKAAPSEMLSNDLAADDHAGAVTSAVVLERLLGFLKPSQSVVIRLVKLHGYGIEEASMRTGQSVSLVKVNIHRGLARLTEIAQQEAPPEFPGTTTNAPS
jgi:RNA polymerase sigma factor (sigma-70 family)